MPARDEDLDVSLADDREASRKARDVLDLGTPPYSPTSHEARVLEQHEERRARQPPKIRVERGRGRQFAVVPDHPDRKIGNAALMSSVGTASAAFMTTILGEIANLTATDGEADERRFQAALALVQGVQPRDGTEAMLAVQMAAVHSATMKMAARMARTESKEVAEIAERSFNKLARTFVSQIEGLKRWRSTGEQVVKHQYVNIADGGQAVIGDVYPREGGLLKQVEQSRLDYAPGVIEEERRRVGAPLGNVNAMKSGRWSADTLAERKEANMLMRQARATIEKLGEFSDTGE